MKYLVLFVPKGKDMPIFIRAKNKKEANNLVKNFPQYDSQIVDV